MLEENQKNKKKKKGKALSAPICAGQQLKMQAKRSTSAAYFGASFNLALKQQAKKL